MPVKNAVSERRVGKELAQLVDAETGGEQQQAQIAVRQIPSTPRSSLKRRLKRLRNEESS